MQFLTLPTGSASQKGPTPSTGGIGLIKVQEQKILEYLQKINLGTDNK